MGIGDGSLGAGTLDVGICSAGFSDVMIVKRVLRRADGSDANMCSSSPGRMFVFVIYYCVVACRFALEACVDIPSMREFTSRVVTEKAAISNPVLR